MKSVGHPKLTSIPLFYTRKTYSWPSW